MDSFIEKHYNEYDDDPVLYCKQCLSLNIKTAKIDMLDKDIDYCDECGSTDIDQCDIRRWEEMYLKKYGHEYVNRTKPKRSIYFQ